VLNDIKKEAEGRMDNSLDALTGQLQPHPYGARPPQSPRRHQGAVLRLRYAAQPGGQRQRRGRPDPGPDGLGQVHGARDRARDHEVGSRPESRHGGRCHTHSHAAADRGDAQGLHQAGAQRGRGRARVRAQRPPRRHRHAAELVKDKEISEDDERRGEEQIQKLTDSFVARIEEMLAAKEADLLEI
jgi:ribosome recycling factor